MRSVTIPISVLTPTTTAFIECACGNDMHVSFSMCGDCMNEESSVIGMSQRVFIDTRRAFNHGN